MKLVLSSVAGTACLLMSLFAPGCSQAETDRSHVEPAWGKPVAGIRVRLVPEKTEFESGDRDWIGIVLHIRNDSQKKVTLPFAGACNGWRWEFHLVGGGRPFVARWDDDTGGAPAAPPTVVLEPGATKAVQGRFRQRSFNKWGSGFCSLVPGRYRISASYIDPRSRAKGPRNSWKVTSGTIEIEIRPRGNDWDKVATADATTLVGLLGNQDRLLHEAAVAFLAEKGKTAVPALIQGLENGNDSARAACAQILGRLRKDAEPLVVNSLVRALRDGDPRVRVEAATSLGLIGETAKPAVPALISAAKNRHSGDLPDVRPVAASALGCIGDARPEVVAALVELLEDERVRSRSNSYAAVAYAIGRLGPKARDAVLVLVKHLQDKNDHNRWYVLSALRGIGPGAAAAVPTLVRILEDESESIDVRARVAFALGAIIAGEALPALERVRDKYDSAAQEDAAIQVFLSRIREAIAAIRRAESQLPVKTERGTKTKKNG